MKKFVFGLTCHPPGPTETTCDNCISWACLHALCSSHGAGAVQTISRNTWHRLQCPGLFGIWCSLSITLCSVSFLFLSFLALFFSVYGTSLSHGSSAPLSQAGAEKSRGRGEGVQRGGGCESELKEKAGICPGDLHETLIFPPHLQKDLLLLLPVSRL